MARVISVTRVSAVCMVTEHSDYLMAIDSFHKHSQTVLPSVTKDDGKLEDGANKDVELPHVNKGSECSANLQYTFCF